MKSIASFLTDKRKMLLCFFLILAAVCLPLAGMVNINYDLTKYLSADSRMKQGMELMEQEFSLDWKNYVVFGVALLLLFTVSVLQERGVKIRKTVGKWNIVPRWIVYYLMLLAILIFGIYGPAYDASAFIYQAY